MSIIDILLAEETDRVQPEPYLDAAAATAAGFDPQALHQALCADPALLAMHRDLIRHEYRAESVDAERLLERHFETVQAIDGYGTALARLRPAIRDRHRARFPDTVDHGFVLLCDDDDEPLDDDGHPDGPHYASPRVWTLTRYEAAIERQDAARFRLHPQIGLTAALRMTGGPLPDRILDAALFGALGGKRGTRLREDPPSLRVLASRVFLRRFPEYAPDGPPADSGDPLEPGGYALFPMMLRTAGASEESPASHPTASATMPLDSGPIPGG